MLHTNVIAYYLQFVNLSAKDPSGDKRYPNVLFPTLLSTLGTVLVDINLPKVIPSWGSEGMVLELSTGKPLWPQFQSTK